MNSNLVQYEQQRHWTGQVINIHPTSYWSSCREGLVNFKSQINPHFRFLLPCQWVPVVGASCFILPQSEYLFTLWQRVAEMNPTCDELLYYVNGSPTMVVCMIDWSTVLPVFRGIFPKYTQVCTCQLQFSCQRTFSRQYHSDLKVIILNFQWFWDFDSYVLILYNSIVLVLKIYMLPLKLPEL